MMSHEADGPAVALYLHVPFCRTKCAYCDFTSAPDADSLLPEEGVVWAVRELLPADATLADAYCEAVPLFLDEFATRGLLGNVPSVYVGGGTPTVLGERLPRLLGRVLELATLAPDAEVTCEANPDSVDAGLAEKLVAAGVNRFSLGVQSLDADVLATLGRCHTAEQAEA
ncbi:MAG: radical SAM protein, partial [Actinobacteria bacterium]